MTVDTEDLTLALVSVGMVFTCIVISMYKAYREDVLYESVVDHPV